MAVSALELPRSGLLNQVLCHLRLSGLARFLSYKVGRAVAVVAAVTLLTQWVLALTPGGLAASMLGESASPAAIAQLNHQLGLDRPFFVQYGHWVWRALHGNLGRSPISEEPVWTALRAALPTTLELVLIAETLAVVLAVVWATLSARRPGGPADRLSSILTSTGLAVPTFILAPVLLYVVAVKVRIFPVSGWTPLTSNLGGNLRSAILPALCVAMPEFAVFQRLFRADLVAVLEEDYIDAARARGISEARILVRHAFRPASISLVTLTGLSIGRLLGGTFIVESLFVLPGVGQALQQAIIRRDLVTVEGFVVFLAVAYVVINLVVDLLYKVIDPRIKLARAS